MSGFPGRALKEFVDECMGVGGVGETGFGEGCKEGVGGLCGRGWERDERTRLVGDTDVPQAVMKSVVLLSARPKNLSEFSRTNLVMSVDMKSSSGLGKHRPFMKLVSTFHPPSSVLDSLKCTLADEHGSEFLVVAKLDRVDIYSLQSEGLRHEQGIEIWGRIRTVKLVPIVVLHIHSCIYSVNNALLARQHTTRLSLLVLTDHPEPELVFLRFTVSKSGERDLSATRRLALFGEGESARPAEFCHDVLVDPSGAIAVVSIYTGKFKIITLTEEGCHEDDFNVSSACNFVAQDVKSG